MGGSSPTYGQTFTATAANNVLTQMTFSIRNANAIDYRALVYAWTGTQITGTALFSSSNLTLPASAPLTPVAINTGATALTVGQQYVAFFTTTLSRSSSGGAEWGYLGTGISAGADGYTGGNFVFSSQLSFSNLSTTPWDDPTLFFGQAAHDLAFRLDFQDSISAAPAPPTLLALVAGFLTLAFASRLRRPVVVS